MRFHDDSSAVRTDRNSTTLLGAAPHALSSSQTARLLRLRESAHWLALAAGALLLLPLCYEIGWLRSWYRPDSPEAYQPLIPLGAVALAWVRRQRIAAVATALRERANTPEEAGLEQTRAERRVRPGSIFPAALGCALMALNHLWRYQEVSVIAIVLVVAGAASYLYAPIMVQTLRTSLLFLLLMAPLPHLLLSQTSQMLQVNSTEIAGGLLQALGVPVNIMGNALVLPHYRLEITAACGGIGILLALQIMTLWLLAMHRPSAYQSILLFSFVTMLTLVTNILRIVAMGLIALKTPALAGSLHDANSWLFALLLFGLIYWTGRRLRILPQWTYSQPDLSNTASAGASTG